MRSRAGGRKEETRCGCGGSFALAEVATGEADSAVVVVLALSCWWSASMSAPRSWHGRHSSACDEKADDRGESGGREVDGAVSGSCKQRGARVLRGAAAARGADPIRIVQRAAGQI